MDPLPPPSALVFDLDGTLVDSKRDIAEALNAALVEVGRVPRSLDEVAGMIGDGARMLCVRGLGDEGTDAPLVDRTVAAFGRAYAARPCRFTTLLPGARESLAIALPRALVTNKPRAVTELLLAELGVRAAFGAIYAGGDGPLKPSPDGIRSVAAALDVDAATVWMVGDGPQDVRAGLAAGCTTLAVPGIADREHVLAAGPHRIVESLLELPPLVAAAIARSGRAPAP